LTASCFPLQDQSSSTSALKIQALQFLALALHKASQEVWRRQIGKLAPPVLLAVADKYYKVSAEALRVCEELVHSIRPNLTQPLQPVLQVRPTLPPSPVPPLPPSPSPQPP